MAKLLILIELVFHLINITKLKNPCNGKNTKLANWNVNHPGSPPRPCTSLASVIIPSATVHNKPFKNALYDTMNRIVRKEGQRQQQQPTASTESKMSTYNVYNTDCVLTNWICCLAVSEKLEAYC